MLTIDAKSDWNVSTEVDHYRNITKLNVYDCRDHSIVLFHPFLDGLEFDHSGYCDAIALCFGLLSPFHKNIATSNSIFIPANLDEAKKIITDRQPDPDKETCPICIAMKKMKGQENVTHRKRSND